LLLQQAYGTFVLAVNALAIVTARNTCLEALTVFLSTVRPLAVATPVMGYDTQQLSFFL
jgi:hypothetical protein